MSDTDTDVDRLSARLAAVERALTDRACDCAHEAFSPTEREPRVDPTRDGTDPALREAVETLCEYVLACERVAEGSTEHTEAVREALDELTDPRDSPSAVERPDRTDRTDRTERTPVGPREWLERVAATAFE